MTPRRQRKPRVASRAARFVSGQNLFVDFGYEAAVDTGARVGLL